MFNVLHEAATLHLTIGGAVGKSIMLATVPGSELAGTAMEVQPEQRAQRLHFRSIKQSTL